jgi:diguanylate cyclase
MRERVECLAPRVRETDFLARYGGQEFVMILAGTSLADARKGVEPMRESVAKLGFHFPGLPVSVLLSCGVTAFREGDTADDALGRADKALYEAKADGRNRCEVG